MSQLVSPREALNQAFVLPKLSAESSRSGAAAQAQSSVFSGYGVTMGNLGLLLPTGVTSHLVEIDIRLCRLPTAPAWLLGVANLNGNSVPMFNLEQLLDLPHEAPSTKYLVIGEGDQAAGIAIAGHPQRVRLGLENKLTRNPPLPASLQPHVQAVYRREQIWVAWDFQAFFSAVGQRI